MGREGGKRKKKRILQKEKNRKQAFANGEGCREGRGMGKEESRHIMYRYRFSIMNVISKYDKYALIKNKAKNTKNKNRGFL